MSISTHSVPKSSSDKFIVDIHATVKEALIMYDMHLDRLSSGKTDRELSESNIKAYMDNM